MRKPTQRKLIQQSIDTIQQHTIQCCICCTTAVVTDFSIRYALDNFLYWGWKYSTSEKYAMEGTMCPDCFKTPDAERGEL